MGEKIEKSKLREKAEKIFQTQQDQMDLHSKDDDNIHELRVHQIELEIQNEELRRAQIDLEDSRRKYFDLYNFAPIGYFTLDRDGLIFDVNLSGASLLGVERFHLQKSAFMQFITMEHRQKFHNHIQEVLKTETKKDVELKFLRREDKPFYALCQTIKILDEHGNFKEFRLAVTNIDPLKKTENALKRQSFLLNISSEAIFSWDYEDGILSWNHGAEMLYGYNTDEAISHHVNELLKTEFPIDYNQYMKLLNDEKKWAGELIHTTKYGKKIIVESRQQLIQNDSKKIVIENNRDITKRKEMENLIEYRSDKLAKINKLLNVEIGDHLKAETKLKNLIEKYKQSNEELEQFAYIASHDLKEPLRMITSFLQLLQKRNEDDLDKDAIDFINYAVEGAKRMDAMINDLLDYSRISNEEHSFEYVYCEEILETVLLNLKTLIDDTNAVVTHDPLPLIFSNTPQMTHLFQNIIDNSIKYRGDRTPKIHISVEDNDNEYLFTITDNGIGIDEKHLKRIFTIFKRLHSREEYDGTGIGLSISKKIVEKHRGKIWAESEVGKGSKFYFTIPHEKVF